MAPGYLTFFPFAFLEETTKIVWYPNTHESSSASKEFLDNRFWKKVFFFVSYVLCSACFNFTPNCSQMCTTLHTLSRNKHPAPCIVCEQAPPIQEFSMLLQIKVWVKKSTQRFQINSRQQNFLPPWIDLGILTDYYLYTLPPPLKKCMFGLSKSSIAFAH